MGAIGKLGKRIRTLREKRGLTQEALAEKSETSSQYISALERGLKNVTFDMLEKVANGLGVELITLFSFDSSNDQPSKQALKKLIEQADERDTRKIAKIITILTNE